MATPSEKLAQSLEALAKLQKSDGGAAIRARDLSRTHRERLLAQGFLQLVLKGWLIPSRPDNATTGESTAWYASYWQFCAVYLRERFGTQWSLSPEQSLSLHAANWTVPSQLMVRAPKARNAVTKLPHGTSLLDLRSSLPVAADRQVVDGLQVFSQESALLECSPNFFSHNSTDVRAVLLMVRDASGLLARLLAGGHTIIAGRLAGAFRNIGRDRIADDIVKTMTAAGYAVRENDPFSDRPNLVLRTRETSPYVNRIRLLWQKMREPIIERFPKAPGTPSNIAAYLKRVNETYVTDAYHSLSIEGYRVTADLIERVRAGSWNPETNEGDREQRNAMAARGYWLAFQSVQQGVGRVLRGDNPGQVADDEHGAWYRELFAPSVASGILKPVDLAGYRNSQVYIRKSMHVPLNRDAVRDAMPAFFDLLREETHPAVRVVLGHFLFVYIHPYMDGNGRIGRFLMNVMLASGGYPWTVIPVSDRNVYMNALERASVGEDIVPFSDFIAGLVRKGLAGEPLPAIPKSS
ncbi:Fic/DOC family protein [Granulicella rosea]|uniref:Fic/DOC family protein n=1 Tax=Granulicella rosea TaxID=474952 RepID=A0A239GQI5_9BACT|nr:Fic family protein [Granulicella rosea]SNS70773.1 Fic/DOC family protein [Granulicella rosea]